tara:strand:+ start:270 stop:446 length:177 start_codon:yes stop_codon:yes gene_type:complete
MSEKELKNQIKFEQRSKLVVGGSFLLLVVTMLFLTSCAPNNYQSCAAYASVDVKNDMK